MRQLDTRLLRWSALTGVSLFFMCCQFDTNCRELTGQWTNREGQYFQFEPNGQAYWLIKFGSEFDTFPIQYQYDCKQKPATLDLSGFRSGPLKGRTLFGILEWTSDSSFRFDGEPGTSNEVRPKAFNPEQTQRYYREATK